MIRGGVCQWETELSDDKQQDKLFWRTPGMDLIRQFHYDNEARHWPTGAVFAVIRTWPTLFIWFIQSKLY